MSLKNMAPIIPEREAERAQLEQDLEGMGCVGLLRRPLTIKKKEFVHEFITIWEKQVEQRNIFDTTIQDRPKDWTVGVWRGVYHFLSRGSELANQMETYVEGKFL